MALDGRILITGGAGFLARAMYRKARAEKWDAEFTALSRDDSKHAALRGRYPEVHTIRGDVAGDLQSLIGAFRGHDTVIHMAAVKYVDASEYAVWDTTRVNVDGARNVAAAAAAAGVKRVVGISTDKACEPRNVYGMTKAMMERLFLEADGWQSETRFGLVRFGNLVASTGSVIDIFRARLAKGERIQITDPAMRRYWMPAGDAVEVIEQAWLRFPGVVAVPTLRTMDIGGVAVAAGADAGMVDIIGVRPGEKFDEQMLSEEEARRSVAWGSAMALLPGPRGRFPECIDMEFAVRPEPLSTADGRKPIAPSLMREWIEDAAGI